MSRLQIIRPEATTNLCTNPSVERNTTGWANSGLTTFARSSTWQAVGAWALRAIADAIGDKAQAPTITPTSGLPYTAMARVHVVSGTWKVTFGAGSQLALTAGDYDVVITVTPGTGAAIRLELEATALASGAAEAFIDRVQYEQKDHATSYCDGDQDGCVWSSTPHGSASSRSAEVRSGGRMIDLMDDATIGFLYADIIGVGVPPLSHLTTDLGLIDGAKLQRVKAQPAVIAFNATQRASSLPGLHALRRVLVDLVKPDAVAPLQPLRLRYSGSGTQYDIDAFYLAGLEGNIPPPSGRESLAMQFIAYDPRWRERFDVGTTLACNASVSANRVIANIGGTWTALGTGANDIIIDAAVDSAGRVFVVGQFTSIGGVSANRVAYFDPADGLWHAMGTGLSDKGFAVTIGPDGLVYVGGLFVTAGGVTCNLIAKWDPVGAAWSALGTGFGPTSTGAVEDLVFGPDGKLYIGGFFTTANGESALGMATWDGNALNDVAGVNLSEGNNVGVTTLAIGPSGKIYAGGNFFTATYDFEDLAAFDPATGTWAEVDSEFNSPPTAIVAPDDGYVYAGGVFTSPFTYIARYNGSQLVELGSGTDSYVTALAKLASGEIAAGGWFTRAGGLVLSDRIARWTGSTWKPFVVDLPGSAPVQKIVTRDNGDYYIVGQFAGTAVAPGVSTVTNPGSSESYPVVRVTGPGTLRGLVNMTTGAEILFDSLQIASGEIVSIDLRPGRKSVSSNVRANLIGYVLAGSEVASWSLLPGANQIALLVEPTIGITTRTATTAKNAGSTGMTLNKPVGLATGDVLLASFSIKGGSGVTITPATGFTLVGRVNVGAGATDEVVAVYQKVVTNAGTEPGTYTFTLSGSKAWSARMAAFVGVDNTTPTSGVVSASGSAITSLAIPATTATVAGSIFRTVMGGGTGTIDIVLPGSLTKASQAGDASTPRLETAYDALLAVGDTGAQTITVATSEQLAAVGYVLNASAALGQPTADIFFRPRHWGAE